MACPKEFADGAGGGALDTVGNQLWVQAVSRALYLRRRAPQTRRYALASALRNGGDCSSSGRATQAIQPRLWRQPGSVARAVRGRDSAGFAGADGRGRLCVADRMRERGKSLAGARGGAANRDCRARSNGRKPGAHRAAVADGKRIAGDNGRHCRVLLAWLGASALIKLSPPELGDFQQVEISISVLGFTFIVAMLTGVIFGLAPAFEASNIKLNDTLKEAGRSLAGASRSRRLRGALVVAEVA